MPCFPTYTPLALKISLLWHLPLLAGQIDLESCLDNEKRRMVLNDHLRINELELEPPKQLWNDHVDF